MKERDTVIVPIRVKKDMIPEIVKAVKSSRQPSRNAWLNWAISIGLRKHNKKESNES